MHYYKKNIGDYHKKAGRLSMLEHGAYTLLMDSCYDRERFPTFEEAIEWTWARSEDEIAAVKFVLSRFFEQKDGIYMQDRIREEIAAFKQKSSKNKDIAIKREEDKREAARSVHEQTTTEHLTTNQEPLPHKPQAGDLPGFNKFWATWPPHIRKSAKAQCLAKWVKHELEAITDKICDHVTFMRSHETWLKNAGEFIPAPLVYLNQQRWTAHEELATSGPWDSSRASIEAEGVRLGVGLWDETGFQQGAGFPFHAYTAKVRAARLEAGHED